MGRTYRTRLEVLHDFLDASRRASRKTRIIGLANLNPAYFDSYARFCVEQHLLEVTREGYRPTELADQVLAAIRQVLSKTAELDGAIRSLDLVLRREDPTDLRTVPLGLYPPDGWHEIVLHSIPRLSLPNSGVRVRGPATTRAAIPSGSRSRTLDLEPSAPRGRPSHPGGRWRDPPELLP